MALFKKVVETKSGVKVLIFGGTGTGKSKALLTFPKICAIDSEDGLAFYKGKNNNLLYILQTTSADEVEEAIEEVEEDLVEEIQTFGIDSETKIYENMQHSALNVAERRARNKGTSVDDANISQREWGKIKLVGKRIQSGKITLSSKGINVVSIAQEKELKEKKGENWVVVGYAPDTAKGFDYDYDIVVRCFTEVNSKGEIEYKGEIRKDRTEVYKKGDIITNVSYEHWRDVVEGKSHLEADVVDFRKDIAKDENKLRSELEELEGLTEELKDLAKKISAEKKTGFKELCKELKIENPLKCTDLEKMKKLVAFCK